MLSKCLRMGFVLLSMACCMPVRAGVAAARVDSAGDLDRADGLQKTDHPKFLKLLAQLDRQTSHMTPAERWHLRYLDAWEATYEGDYARANPQFREIMARSGDSALATKAAALLLSNLGFTHQYMQAYELAARLVTGLPAVKDAPARFALLFNLSLTMDYAGQYGLAINYARMMEASVPPGEALCSPRNLQMAATYDSGKLEASSQELQRAIDTCVAAKRPAFANALWLMQDAAYLDEGQPGKALALLERIGPAIKASGYYPQILSMHAKQAMAHAQLGQDDAAHKAALAVLAMDRAGGDNEWLRAADKVLYEVAKRQGRDAEALRYFMQYVALDKAYRDDMGARAQAYEVVRQHVLTQQLQTEQLARQNAALHLRSALDAKTAEANRLYLALLLLLLAAAAVAMFRLKRSQLRFQRLSRVDGLTAVLNRQSFMAEIVGTLQRLERKAGAACLVYLDLDHFKRINDTHGHAVGDEALRQVVATCRQHLRPVDVFGRLGGEEFGILMVDCSREQGRQIANRIRRAIEAAAVEYGGLAVAVTASVGLACTDSSSHDPRLLCTDADAALYLAKDSGRNCVVADGGRDALVA